MQNRDIKVNKEKQIKNFTMSFGKFYLSLKYKKNELEQGK